MSQIFLDGAVTHLPVSLEDYARHHIFLLNKDAVMKEVVTDKSDVVYLRKKYGVYATLYAFLINKVQLTDEHIKLLEVLWVKRSILPEELRSLAETWGR